MCSSKPLSTGKRLMFKGSCCIRLNYSTWMRSPATFRRHRPSAMRSSNLSVANSAMNPWSTIGAIMSSRSAMPSTHRRAANSPFLAKPLLAPVAVTGFSPPGNGLWPFQTPIPSTFNPSLRAFPTPTGYRPRGLSSPTRGVRRRQTSPLASPSTAP